MFLMRIRLFVRQASFLGETVPGASSLVGKGNVWPASVEAFTLTLYRQHHSEMRIEATSTRIFDIAPQGFMDDRECQALPGDLVMRE